MAELIQTDSGIQINLSTGKGVGTGKVREIDVVQALQAVFDAGQITADEFIEALTAVQEDFVSPTPILIRTSVPEPPPAPVTAPIRQSSQELERQGFSLAEAEAIMVQQANTLASFQTAIAPPGPSAQETQQQALIQARENALVQGRTFIDSADQAMLLATGLPQSVVGELSQILFDMERERVETERLRVVEQERFEAEQERIAVQERQTSAFEALPSRLRSDTGVAALTALGSFPDTPQTALGDILPSSLLQSIGFALPEGATLNAGLRPREFFSGGLPTVSQLQNFNQQELGLLGGIVSLGGTGEPFDLRQRSAGITPLPAGTVTGTAGALADISPQARPRARRI